MAKGLKNEAFAPELAKPVKETPAGDAWLHEVKWDGYRIVATIVDGNVRLWSRNAIEWASEVPELAAAIRSLMLKSAQLNGEMIVPTETGSSDLLDVGRAQKSKRATGGERSSVR